MGIKFTYSIFTNQTGLPNFMIYVIHLLVFTFYCRE